MEAALGQITAYILFFTGIFLLLRFREFSTLVEELLEIKSLFYLICGLYASAGLVIISLHNVWVYDGRLLLTLLGWAMALEGMAYCLLPFPIVRRWARKFYHPAWWFLCGICAIIISFFLLSVFV